MKFSRLRTLLLTCCFGIAFVSAYARINGYLDSPPVKVLPVVNVPQVKSETPLIVRVCPEILTQEERDKFYKIHHYDYREKTVGINCVQGGGGGSGGVSPISKGRLLANDNPPLIPPKFKNKN